MSTRTHGWDDLNLQGCFQLSDLGTSPSRTNPTAESVKNDLGIAIATLWELNKVKRRDGARTSIAVNRAITDLGSKTVATLVHLRQKIDREWENEVTMHPGMRAFMGGISLFGALIASSYRSVAETLVPYPAGLITIPGSIFMSEHLDAFAPRQRPSPVRVLNDAEWEEYYAANRRTVSATLDGLGVVPAVVFWTVGVVLTSLLVAWLVDRVLTSVDTANRARAMGEAAKTYQTALRCFQAGNCTRADLEEAARAVGLTADALGPPPEPGGAFASLLGSAKTLLILGGVGMALFYLGPPLLRGARGYAERRFAR